MFIHHQKLRRDGNRRIVSGNASVYRSEYDPNALPGNSRRETAFRLGKVGCFLTIGKGSLFTLEKGVHGYLRRPKNVDAGKMRKPGRMSRFKSSRPSRMAHWAYHWCMLLFNIVMDVFEI